MYHILKFHQVSFFKFIFRNFQCVLKFYFYTLFCKVYYVKLSISRNFSIFLMCFQVFIKELSYSYKVLQLSNTMRTPTHIQVCKTPTVMYVLTVVNKSSIESCHIFEVWCIDCILRHFLDTIWDRKQSSCPKTIKLWFGSIHCYQSINWFW